MGRDLVHLNGSVVAPHDAKISVFDTGFLRGVGVFETLRTFNGHPYALREHLDRLWAGAAELDIPQLHSIEIVRQQIAELYKQCGHDELRINIIVSPGDNTDGLFGAEKPTWVLIAKQLHAVPETLYSNGGTAITFAGVRALPHIKTTNYLSGRQGYAHVQAAKANEGFYVDEQGCVCEGITSNILIIRKNTVYDPAAQSLRGITKMGLRTVAEQAGLSWSEQSVTRDDCYTADELLITSSIRLVLPIVQLDGKTIANGKPGLWAQKLLPLYRTFCTKHACADATA